ncbi:hypothetical protein NEPAR06_2204 [Nematocida parisii]|uniref:uncharacterized protein n=1 Tax=Nematocida parisii (strain ERTm1 / ATCC PRA-289) TaxID=881290 RepID=UPI000264B1AA|nr:uncharacterized protein NEPG_00928 [Nematocida parisii ERTm1]EIJ94261.1 hypothetical protein NEPG_00928 [Nematocida parisii ERTm1]KAI5145950.1 hypothetical protein NEPAR07_1980 [Nematocida parisii]KAI5156601.1 hypothetical protein NEPAR06_2204 [Nematocida parisii]|eukprot:XP_013058757.1 hypothetical protein NEPG_00928 [Nematocida parisii ERTm1]
MNRTPRVNVIGINNERCNIDIGLEDIIKRYKEIRDNTSGETDVAKMGEYQILDYIFNRSISVASKSTSVTGPNDLKQILMALLFESIINNELNNENIANVRNIFFKRFENAENSSAEEKENIIRTNLETRQYKPQENNYRPNLLEQLFKDINQFLYYYNANNNRISGYREFVIDHINNYITYLYIADSYELKQSLRGVLEGYENNEDTEETSENGLYTLEELYKNSINGVSFVEIGLNLIFMYRDEIKKCYANKTLITGFSGYEKKILKSIRAYLDRIIQERALYFKVITIHNVNKFIPQCVSNGLFLNNLEMCTPEIEKEIGMGTSLYLVLGLSQLSIDNKSIIMNELAKTQARIEELEKQENNYNKIPENTDCDNLIDRTQNRLNKKVRIIKNLNNYYAKVNECLNAISLIEILDKSQKDFIIAQAQTYLRYFDTSIKLNSPEELHRPSILKVLRKLKTPAMVMVIVILIIILIWMVISNPRRITKQII